LEGNFIVLLWSKWVFVFIPSLTWCAGRSDDNVPSSEIRAVIRFLILKNMTGTEIHRDLTETYGENMLSVQKVRKWVTEFKNGRESVDDNARPHSARQTHDLLKPFHWNVFPHPSYSSDIAPSDYHPFPDADRIFLWEGKASQTTQNSRQQSPNISASRARSTMKMT